MNELKYILRRTLKSVIICFQLCKITTRLITYDVVDPPNVTFDSGEYRQQVFIPAS